LQSQYTGMLIYDCKANDLNTGQAGIVDYAFNVLVNDQPKLVQNTSEFRINPVTCIIRAEIVFDREQVFTYVVSTIDLDINYETNKLKLPGKVKIYEFLERIERCLLILL
jgi:hypothetical protein